MNSKLQTEKATYEDPTVSQQEVTHQSCVEPNMSLSNPSAMQTPIGVACCEFRDSHLSPLEEKSGQRTASFSDFPQSFEIFPSQLLSCDPLVSERDGDNDGFGFLSVVEENGRDEVAGETVLVEDRKAAVWDVGREETFFGLPMKVKELLVENRQITSLYGEMGCLLLCVLSEQVGEWLGG